MKRCIKSVFLILLVFTTFIGCSSKNSNKDDITLIPTENDELICEETISPNKEYVTSDEDIVNYTIQIYQIQRIILLLMQILILAFLKKHNMY